MSLWEGKVDGLVITLKSDKRPSDDDFREAAADYRMQNKPAPQPPPTPQLN